MHANTRIKLAIFLNYFTFAILLNSVGSVILQVQSTYGIKETEAAILEAFKDLSIAGISFLVASFINRLGYKKAMLIALGANALICLMMPTIHSFGMTKLLFAVAGAGFGMIKVSVFGTIGLISKDQKDHLATMNFIESFFMVGIMCGGLLFGAFVSTTNPTAWLQVYYALGALATISFFLLLSTPIDESANKAEASNNDFVAMFRLLVMPLVLSFVACAFLYVLIEQSIMSWLPTFNNKVLALPAALSIQMASILAVSTATGRFIAGIVLKKYKWFSVLVPCILSSAALVLLALPLAQNVSASASTSWSDAPFVAFIFPLIGFFLAPIYPAINSLILSALPVQKHGIMSGLIVIFSALGGTTGSILTGYIFEHYGGQNAFYFSLIPMTLLIILLFVFKKMVNR